MIREESRLHIRISTRYSRRGVAVAAVEANRLHRRMKGDTV